MWMPPNLMAVIYPRLHLAMSKPKEFIEQCGRPQDRAYLAYFNPEGFLVAVPGEEGRSALATANPKAFARLFPGGTPNVT